MPDLIILDDPVRRDDLERYHAALMEWFRVNCEPLSRRMLIVGAVRYDVGGAE